jgi:sensor histidine kinase YesM
MKKMLSVLLILFLFPNCFAQEVEKFPKIPWEEIVEMNGNRYNPLSKHDVDLRVNLTGNYTEIDSLYVLKILEKFNFLTETISVKLAKDSISNFSINFSNTAGRQITYLQLTTNIEWEIAKRLVSGTFYYLKSDQKRNSVFNQSREHNNSNVPLSDEDFMLIREVYKKGFEGRLKKAENQFKYVLENIEEVKVLERHYDLWWVKTPISVLFIPILILVLLSIFLVGRAKKIIDGKIKNDWLRFTIISLLSIFFLYFIIVFYLNFYNFLQLPVRFHHVEIWDIEAVVVIGLLPFLYLFRFVELKIQQSSQNIFVKTGLIFLSTGFIPMTCYLILFALILKNEDGFLTIHNITLNASQFFLVLMSIATARTLIGFFIFKERNLLIENENKLSALRELKTQAELKSLQSQINPHFLYNALNSIATLAKKDGEKTEKMVLSLSDLFKYTINRKGKKNSTIKDEIEMVQNYLEIEQIRFGDRLQFNIEVPEELASVEIPMFIIQPLIENAVKHGISKNEGHGEIALKIEKSTDGITILVEDNGPDFPDGLVSGHGLQTVYDLLRLSYGEDASMRWSNEPEKGIFIKIVIK